MKRRNRTYRILLLAALTVGMASCHRELDTYEGEDGMYFATEYKGAELFSDTIDVSWGMKNSSVLTQEIELVVKLLGNTAPVDRSFNIVIEEAPTYVSVYNPNSNNDDDEGTVVTPPASEEEETEPTVPTLNAEDGVDYTIPGRTFVIQAGTAQAVIPVTLMRRDDLHLAKRSFKVRIIENPSLKFLYSRTLPEYDEEGNITLRPMDFQRIIRMDESFPIPTWWYVRGEPYFGTWSQAKAMLICDVMNIDRERWMADDLPNGYLRFCGQYMHKYLQENPHYEDDGVTLMEMGEQSKV